MKELENDRYTRCVEGYLPAASVAFVDEVFKANSAILNSMLTLLNERSFDNGASRVPAPLVALVGASNELPDSDELAALFDRFLVRYQVGPVPLDRFAEMALATEQSWDRPSERDRLTTEELESLRAAARALPLAPDVAELLRDLREAAPALGLAVSDRRWKKVVKMLRTVAVVDGRDEVIRWDFWIVPHCLWDRPEQRASLQKWYEQRLGVDSASVPERTRRIVAAMQSELDEMRRATEPVVGKNGRPLYRGEDGSERTGPDPRQVVIAGEPRYLAPADRVARGGDRTNGGQGYTAAQVQHLLFHGWGGVLQNYQSDPANWLLEAPPQMVLQPRRFSQAEIDDCISQLAPAREAVEAALRDLQQRIREVEEVLAAHVIVPSSFRDPALRGLLGNQVSLEEARRELARLAEGFRLLPRKPQRAAA